MRYAILLITSGLFLFLCVKERSVLLIGSWYSLDRELQTYEEIHIDDSLFIRCFDNCNAVVTFNYFIRKDSLFLLSDNSVQYKYMIEWEKDNFNKFYLILEKDTLLFEKLDSSYINLNNFLRDFDSLDSLCYDYFDRRKIIFGKNIDWSKSEF